MKMLNKLLKLLICCFLLVNLFGCDKKGEEVEPIGEVPEEKEPKEDKTEETGEPTVTEETVTEEPVEETVDEVDEHTKFLFSYEDDNADYTDDVPHRYRSVKSELKKAQRYGTDSEYIPSLDGFYNTKMSGSAQFSADQFDTLVSMLKDLAGGNNICIVDLRQESHLFIDGVSVSWTGSNEGLSTDEVMAAESELEEELKVALPDSEIKSEKELVEEYGLSYVRFASKDSAFPTETMVDEFLDFAKNTSKSTWLHFHCKEGKGRTTVFMTMYDIYRNNSVSLKDIAYREYCIGGQYVLYDGCNEDIESPNRPVYAEREEKTRLFYDYMHSTERKKGMSWTDWYEDNKDNYK